MGLAEGISQATATPLPTLLGGTAVEIGGIRAPLYFDSPGQVNFQVPFELAPGSVDVRMVTTEGTSAPHSVKLDAVAPAIFSRGGNGLSPPLLISSDFQLLDSVVPLQTIILYAAGLGQTDPAWSSGTAGGVSPVQQTVLPVLVGVGDTGTPVWFAGAAPGFAGVYQLNITIPPHPATDVLAIAVRQDNIGVFGPSLSIPIRNPAVKQATGSIEFLYPAPGYAANILPVPVVVRYSADVETIEGAGDYLLSLSCNSGESHIMVSPATGRYAVDMYVPTLAARQGDFSATDLLARDLLLPGGPPFPNNVVPPNRLDPAGLRALNLVPAPNGAAAARSPLAPYQGAGTFAAGTHFHLDGATTPDPTIAAGYLSFPSGTVPQGSSNYGCSLFLDGMVLDRKSISIRWP